MDISLHDFSSKIMIKNLQLILNPKEGKKLTSDLIFSGVFLFAFTQDFKKDGCVWSLFVS